MRRMPEERENELVLMAQKGSTKAFGELEKQYHWLVFKVCKGILCEASGDAVNADAEDATQDAFEYAFVHIKDYKPGRFYRWLWSVGRVSALRLRRKLWKQDSREIEFNEELVGGENNIDAADFAENSWITAVKEMEAFIRQNGIKLPPRQLDDLMLSADGLKPREIAKRTGRKVRAVYNNLDRAKRTARKCVNSAP